MTEKHNIVNQSSIILIQKSMFLEPVSYFKVESTVAAPGEDKITAKDIVIIRNLISNLFFTLFRSQWSAHIIPLSRQAVKDIWTPLHAYRRSRTYGIYFRNTLTWVYDFYVTFKDIIKQPFEKIMSNVLEDQIHQKTITVANIWKWY